MIEWLQENLGPTWYWFILIPVIALVLTFPMLGRGPKSRKRDDWKEFRHKTRSEAMSRAGHRCEAPTFLYWGRCAEEAVEVDHVFPWSAGGPTTLSNSQALCKKHNIAKGSRKPPWWYVLGLENRRRSYFPEGESVEVSAL